MDDELKIKLISNLQCGLGEGPAFDHRNDTFYQVIFLVLLLKSFCFAITDGYY